MHRKFHLQGVGSVRNIILLHTHTHTPYFLETSLTTFFFTPLTVHTRHFSSVAVTNWDWPNFVEFCSSLPTNRLTKMEIFQRFS